MRRSLLGGRDILFIEWLDDEIGLTAKYRFVSKAELSAKFIYIHCHVNNFNVHVFLFRIFMSQLVELDTNLSLLFTFRTFNQWGDH